MARAQRATAPYGVHASRARDQSKRAGEPSARTRRLLPHPPTPAQAAPFASPPRPRWRYVRSASFPKLAFRQTCRFGAHGASKGAFRPYPRCCSRSALPAETAPCKFQTWAHGPIGDASRPMIESSCEIRRESQKKLSFSVDRFWPRRERCRPNCGATCDYATIGPRPFASALRPSTPCLR